MARKWLEIVVLSLATISVSSASVYVVDSVTGNDNNSGLLQSGSNPWSQAKKTITAAINAASSGDDVWVAGGQFSFGTEIMPLPLAGKQLFIGGGFKVGDSSRSQAKPAVVPTEVISPLTFLDLQSGLENQSTFDGLRFIYSPFTSGGAISTLFNIIGGATQFSRCWFSKLNTGANGPAVFIADGGSPKLVQNVFLSCSADLPANGVFEFINVSAADVHSNLFADSSSLNPFRSLMYVKGTAKITNNSFFYSSMPALKLDSSTAVLANNLFIGSQILSLGTWVVQTPSSIVTAGHNAFQYQLHATFPANSPYSTLATAAGDLFVTNDAGVVQPSGSWAAPPNFHLKANSVCINKAAPSQVLHPLDLDGQSRALGLFNLGNEIGCDEVWTSLADIMFAGNV
ncbi:MAG: hypothetical protein JNM04_05080, partial [Chthonomonas sp.]|nr:hypothetical protein [Chthonomonas sp.]